jgi:iron complex outermembrane receptor protein
VAGVAAGAPICRSTLTNPTNGCVPMNVFGEGSLGAARSPGSPGAAEGLRTRQDLDFYQDVWSIDAQYSPFSTWAGPVSIAAGFEYRKESFSSTADALSLASLWNVGNFKPGSNGYNVKEFFGEVLVPLLKDSAVAKNLEFNGAIRRTDYSTSGAVTTWKAGLTWEVIDGLRLRGTRSRDIRAPNLNDLFAPSSQFVNAYLDRTQPGSPQVPNITLSGGNPNLTPEIADTWTAGGIYTPRWLPGLSFSVDWYKIDIKDAITAVGAQQIIDMCYGFNRPVNPAACRLHRPGPRRHQPGERHHLHQRHQRPERGRGRHRLRGELSCRLDQSPKDCRARSTCACPDLAAAEGRDQPARRLRPADPGHFRQPEVARPDDRDLCRRARAARP